MSRQSDLNFARACKRVARVEAKLPPIPTRINWTPERIEAELIRVAKANPDCGCVLNRLSISQRKSVATPFYDYTDRAAQTFGITYKQACGLMLGWDLVKEGSGGFVGLADPEFTEMGRRIARAVPE